MTLRTKYLFLGGALGTGVVVALGTVLLQWPASQPGRVREQTTADHNKAWVEQHFRRKFRSIRPEGSGVRLETWSGEVYYRKKMGNTTSSGHQHAASVLLYVGDTIEGPDGQVFTVSRLSADRMVIDYVDYENHMGQRSKDMGTVELAYRK